MPECAEVMTFEVFERFAEQGRKVVQALRATFRQPDKHVFEHHLILVLGDLASQLLCLDSCCQENRLRTELPHHRLKVSLTRRIESTEEVGDHVLDEPV